MEYIERTELSQLINVLESLASLRNFSFGKSNSGFLLGIINQV